MTFVTTRLATRPSLLTAIASILDLRAPTVQRDAHAEAQADMEAIRGDWEQAIDDVHAASAEVLVKLRAEHGEHEPEEK